MGADLYLNKLDDAILKQFPYPKDGEKWDTPEANANREGRGKARDNQISYFRDSYNGTNLMWLIQFSYWKTPESLGWKFTKDGNLSIKGVKSFQKYLKDNESKLDNAIDSLTEDWCESNHCDKGIGGWKTYFKEKKKRLYAFVDKAVVLHSTIRWSV